MLPRLKPLVLLFLFLLPATASATTVRYVTLEEAARNSAFVFHGTVESVETRNLATDAAPQIVTDVTFTVHRVLKGRTKGPQFTLRLIGGSWEGKTVHVPGTPRFKAGDEVVLLLEWTGGNYAIVGMRQGLYRVRQTDTGKAAARDLDELCILRQGGDKPVIEHRHVPEADIPLDALFRTIRDSGREGGKEVVR